MNNYKLSEQIAEEAQLKAEEKWIKDALRKIKKQRNCLQIERLHLENLRAQLLTEKDGKLQPIPRVEPSQFTSAITPQIPDESTRNRLEFELPVIDEQNCNFEELNLVVNDVGVGNNANRMSFDSEEDEYEMNDDDEMNEDTVLDLNQFINGHLPDVDDDDDDEIE